MDNMRWILLLAGVVIVIGIYLVSRLQTRRGTSLRRSARRTTAFTADTVQDAEHEHSTAVEEELERMEQLIAEEPAHVIEKPRREQRPSRSPEAAPADRVFSIFVLAPAGVPFRGPVLVGAMEEAGLEYGDMQIFHRYEHSEGGVCNLFSVANIREPGIFDLSAMDHFTTEGLALFMQLPGPADGVRAFDDMVETARALAAILGGTVCDATRSVLTNQTIGHMREEVIGCQLQQRVAKTAS